MIQTNSKQRMGQSYASDNIRLAIELNDIEVFSLLLEKQPLETFNVRFSVGALSSIELAASLGHLEIVSLCLTAGVPVRTALHQACFHGHIKVVELLLNNNVSIELSDGYAGPPLMQACLGDKSNVVGYLLDRGAVSHPQLYPAGKAHTLGALPAFVERGFPVFKDWYFSSKLRNYNQALAEFDAYSSLPHFRLELADSDIKHQLARPLRCLFENGIDLDAKECRVHLHQYYMTVACSRGQLDITSALLERGLDTSSFPHTHMWLVQAVRFSRYDAVKMLIDDYYLPLTSNNPQHEYILSHESLLIEAVLSNDADLLHYLITHGVPVKDMKRHHDQASPLQLAVRQQNLPMVHILINLLDHDVADPTHQEGNRHSYGLTAVQWSVQCYKKENEESLEIVLALLNAISDVSKREIHKEVAIKMAVRLNKVDLVHHLQECDIGGSGVQTTKRSKSSSSSMRRRVTSSWS